VKFHLPQEIATSSNILNNSFHLDEIEPENDRNTINPLENVDFQN